jgi:hypothetical protein
VKYGKRRYHSQVGKPDSLDYFSRRTQASDADVHRFIDFILDLGPLCHPAQPR